MILGKKNTSKGQINFVFKSNFANIEIFYKIRVTCDISLKNNNYILFSVALGVNLLFVSKIG